MRPPSLFKLAGRSFWLLFGGIWFAVGMPFLLIALWQAFFGESPDKTLILIFGLLGVVFGGIGGFLFFREAAQIRLRYRLWRIGQPAEAEVLKVSSTSYTFNGVTQWEIHYRYRDPRGAVYMGRTGPIPPGEAEQFQAGQDGFVRFDPDRPHLSVWTGKSS
jgi:uncharacterized protein DUF3592